MHAPQTLLSRSRPLLLAAALGALSLSGCGQAAKPWETVFKAEGAIAFKGQPAPGATLILYPQDASVPDQVRPTATADADDFDDREVVLRCCHDEGPFRSHCAVPSLCAMA